MDALQWFWGAPPVSRTITALTFVQSLLAYSGVLGFYHVVFLPRLLFQLPPHIWRLASPFLLTGPQLSFVFDLYFMYHYATSLETGSPRFTHPEDFFTYLVFVASVILLTAGCLLGNVIFTSALILAMVYTYAQDNHGRKVTFFIVQIPAQHLPYAMLVVTLITHGWEHALCDSMGIVAAHAHDFLTRIYPAFGGGRNWLTTPNFVRGWFRNVTPDTTKRAYGSAVRQSVPQAGSSSSGGWTSSFQNPWSSRGAGRRLGSN